MFCLFIRKFELTLGNQESIVEDKESKQGCVMAAASSKLHQSHEQLHWFDIYLIAFYHTKCGCSTSQAPAQRREAENLLR
jgi:hypothetical protein